MSIDVRYHIVFFDGDCNFCNSAVLWIIRHDKKKIFKFAALQSEHAQKYLAKKVNIQSLNSLVLHANGHVYTHSDAVLMICRQLSYPFRFFSLFIYVPRKFRDIAYRVIARFRHKLVGNQNACKVLSLEEQARFL